MNAVPTPTRAQLRAQSRSSFLSETTYLALKWVAQILLPALGALYFTLSQIWGFPHGAEVVGTLTAVDLFLGLLLGLSSKAYYNSDKRFDGKIVIAEDDQSKRISLEIDNDPDDLVAGQEVLFKVQNE